MIKNWLVRGDTHGNFTWMNTQLADYNPEETVIIILGDAGFNFYLNKYDERTKKEVNAKGYRIYCVRGNHEARPQSLLSIKIKYDDDVHERVYIEEEYPNIRYFADWGCYYINNYKCLIIGGAYSVDKNWRLSRVGLTEETNIPKKSGWFNNEQLTESEMASCTDWIEWLLQTDGVVNFDFVFSHTCPKQFQPIDLFLGFIDQSTVDDSMEVWMDNIEKKINYHAWLFGHYHKDRIEYPHVEQYFNDIETLDAIAERWEKYDQTGELPWWIEKGPKML